MEQGIKINFLWQIIKSESSVCELNWENYGGEECLVRCGDMVLMLMAKYEVMIMQRREPSSCSSACSFDHLFDDILEVLVL